VLAVSVTQVFVSERDIERDHLMNGGITVVIYNRWRYGHPLSVINTCNQWMISDLSWGIAVHGRVLCRIVGKVLFGVVRGLRRVYFEWHSVSSST